MGNNTNSNINDRYCGNKFKYVRYYNESIYSLNGIGDNEFRLLRALLFYTDYITMCVNLGSFETRWFVMEMAFRGIESSDGGVRRYQGSLKLLKEKKLVLKSSSITGFRSVMVNPRVAFPGDFHDYRRAVEVWDELFTKSIKKSI